MKVTKNEKGDGGRAGLYSKGLCTEHDHERHRDTGGSAVRRGRVSYAENVDGQALCLAVFLSGYRPEKIRILTRPPPEN